jgi:hypothetical protein
MWRRNYLIKHVTEGKMEGIIEITRMRGIRRKQLLDDLRETRGYWKLKEQALDCSLCEEFTLEEAVDVQ